MREALTCAVERLDPRHADPVQCCAIFALYGLFVTQITDPVLRIRVPAGAWGVLRDLRARAVESAWADVLAVFTRLCRLRAFCFVVDSPHTSTDALVPLNGWREGWGWRAWPHACLLEECLLTYLLSSWTLKGKLPWIDGACIPEDDLLGPSTRCHLQVSCSLHRHSVVSTSIVVRAIAKRYNDALLRFGRRRSLLTTRKPRRASRHLFFPYRTSSSGKKSAP